MQRQTDTKLERYWPWLAACAIVISFIGIAVFMGWK
jgi:hypothetical protein